MTVLIVTVGGAHQPILTAIERTKPDHVVFLCSDDQPGGAKGSYLQVIGEGKVLKSNRSLPNPDLPCIAAMAGLQEGTVTVHRNPDVDNLVACYAAAQTMLAEVLRRDPAGDIVADYTGGTKSMGAGLAMAAVDAGCRLQVVSGARSDLTVVVDHSQFVRRVAPDAIHVDRLLRLAGQRLAVCDYAGAAALVGEAGSEHDPGRRWAEVQPRLTFCRALDAWDRFDHSTASDLLCALPGLAVHKAFLGKLLRQVTGFERVQDLLRNAERRALQGRYDDAVGRLYRALELTAQVWLSKRYDVLDTGHVPHEQLPEALRIQLRIGPDDSTVKLALVSAWEYASHHADDPLGRLFARRRQELLGALEARNSSLLAHGLRPIDEAAYRSVVGRMEQFIQDALAAAAEALARRFDAAPQLPTSWPPDIGASGAQ